MNLAVMKLRHNLWRKFHGGTTSAREFGQQLADKIIPWFTLVEIIYKSKSHEEMQLNKG